MESKEEYEEIYRTFKETTYVKNIFTFNNLVVSVVWFVILGSLSLFLSHYVNNIISYFNVSDFIEILLISLYFILYFAIDLVICINLFNIVQREEPLFRLFFKHIIWRHIRDKDGEENRL